MRAVYLLCLVFAAAFVLRAGSLAADEKPAEKAAEKSPLEAQAAADETFLREHKIATNGPGLLAFLRKRFTSPLTEAQIKALIEQLGDESFDKREEASRTLVLLGQKARKPLQAALAHADLEIRYRAGDALKQIDKDGLASQITAAAIRAVVRRKPAGTCELLLAQLPALDEDRMGEEIRAALPALAVRDGKPEPVLVAALKDPAAVKRAAAAVAFCRAKVTALLPAVRKLLEDPEKAVRLEVALALVRLEQKEAVPVLIAQMDRPLDRNASEAEEVLNWLAREKSPQLGGSDESSLRKYREDWEAWWKETGGKIDLSVLADRSRLLGRTVVVLLDDNQVLDLDANSKVRWKIDGVQMPLDVQPLPGDRVLLAEYRGNRVTERNSKGEVIWEKKIPEPLVAQRLPNGNTFMANRDGIVEVNTKGTEVFTYTPPGGQQIMRARKLPGGDILLVTQLGVTHFTRLNRFGKEIRRFGVEVSTSGGKLDVTAAGHVLIPELDNNRVSELDGDGKPVRAISVRGPIAAVALPNGNVIVTSMTDKRAVEIDPAGKEVWEYRRDTRVTRAVRY